MKLFKPDRAYFEPAALNYELGKTIKAYCDENNIQQFKTTSHSQVRGIPGENEKEKFKNAKKTLVVGTKKSLKLDVCRPSADFSFSLMTNCPGNCEYCYLYTTQGKKPYVRVYVNLDEIFKTIDKYIDDRKPEKTVFEAASSGDPLAVEHISGALKKTIEHFGQSELGRLRVVTKFSNVDSLLNAKHNNHTTFRFSINSSYVIKNFEHNTDSLEDRIKASKKLLESGFNIGYLIAPIMIYDGWEEEYENLLNTLEKIIDNKNAEITFELIQHRFTTNAKNIILQRYPNTLLDMNEETRQRKFGKYGRMKYVYSKDETKNIKTYFESLISERFPNGKVLYFT